MGEYKYIIESQFMKSTFCVTCQSTKYFCLIYMNVLYGKLNCLSFLEKKTYILHFIPEIRKLPSLHAFKMPFYVTSFSKFSNKVENQIRSLYYKSKS